MFDMNKNMGKDSLKFHRQFTMSLEHREGSQVKKNECQRTFASILELNGMKWGSFPEAEQAIKCVEHICKKNAQKQGYNYVEPEVDQTFPFLSTNWYVIDGGKDKTSTTETKKEMSADADINSTKQLADVKMFMEGLGFQELVADGKLGGSTEVKNVKQEEAAKESADLMIS